MSNLTHWGCRAACALLASGMLAALSAVCGCRTTSDAPAMAAAGAGGGKSGSQLWSENCMRCHGMRDPSSYGDAAWAVSMNHMRLRANLTRDEYARILAFLQASH